MVDKNKQDDVQASKQNFDAMMTSVGIGIGSAPTTDMPLFDEKIMAYCAELLQKITVWQELNNQDRLLNANATKTSGYAKHEALIKIAEIKLYNALHTSDYITEEMG